MTAVLNLFRLFDAFSESKNISAPLIYRSLVYCVIENPRDEIVREYIWGNFKLIFKAQTAVPISLLIEPLLRQLNDSSVRIATGYVIREFDLSFLEAILQH